MKTENTPTNISDGVVHKTAPGAIVAPQGKKTVDPPATRGLLSASHRPESCNLKGVDRTIGNKLNKEDGVETGVLKPKPTTTPATTILKTLQQHSSPLPPNTPTPPTPRTPAMNDLKGVDRTIGKKLNKEANQRRGLV